MLCEVTHSAGCISANYHIVIFERSYVTVRNICASVLTCRLTVCSRLALAHRCRYAQLIATEC